jgi:hypothetical protein
MPSRHRSDPGSGSGQPRYPGTFLLAFKEALAGMGWEAQRWLGETVECVDDKGRQHVVSLEGIHRRARRVRRAQWPKVIASFLSIGKSHPQDGPPMDLATVQDRLLPRLGPLPPPSSDWAEIWQHSIPGTPLNVHLVLDVEQHIILVPVEAIDKSGTPGEKWLEIALANLRILTPVENFELAHEDSGLLQCAITDNYDCSRALIVESLLPASPFGYLVAVPGRNELLVLPITPEGLNFLPTFKKVIENNHQSDPAPISDEIFWVKDGTWRVMPMKVNERGEACMQPPQEFYAVLREVIPTAEDQ